MDGGGPPRVSASLYVGDLPIDLQNPEDVLFNTFGKIGMVISIKVCRDINTQRSLGYAYVNYQNAADAESAMNALNYQEIQPGFNMRIMWANRDPSSRKHGNNNIFLKNISLTMSTRELHEICKKYGQVTSCKHAHDKAGKNLGYGFVNFETEEAAKDALNDLNSKKEEEMKAVPFMKRADREREAEKTFTALYCKNIDSNATEEDVQKVFAAAGAVKEIFVGDPAKYPTKFALVTMEEHEDAVRAIDTLHESESSLAAADTKLFVTRFKRKADRIAPPQSPFQNDGRNLYVKHLPDAIDEANFKALFAPFGPIQSVNLQRDANGNFRGFAFVCFETKEAADDAIRQMHNKPSFDNRPLYVSLAQHRDSRHKMLDQQYKERMHVDRNMMYYQYPMMAGPPMGGMGMGGGMRMGGHPMAGPPMGGMGMGGPRRMMPPRQQMRHKPMGQRQPMYTSQPPARPAAGDDLSGLANMSREERKNALGERLYNKIFPINNNLAAKITGMLLEMETNEILNVLEDTGMLRNKVDEAMNVLQQHTEQH